MNVIKLEHHLKSLKQKHEILDKEIQEEYKHRIDDVKLKEMKLKKLELKQEIDLLMKKIA